MDAVLLITYKTAGVGCDTNESVSKMGGPDLDHDSGIKECGHAGAAVHI